MKNFLLAFAAIVAFGFANTLSAQITIPSASPSAKLEQKVGLTDVTIEYSRPSVKGRTIFAADGLVPYGKVWRTGANAVTKITFSDDVTVQGTALKAGKYGILTIPEANEWTVHFYEFEGNSFGSYVEKTPVAAVKAKSNAIPMTVQSFMIAIDNLKQNSANIELLWENTYVSLELVVPVDDQVMSNIDKVMAGPGTGDYYNAAVYYHETGKDLNKALTWVQKATNVKEPKFWQVRREAMILGDLGKKKEAIKTAKKSLELAKAAGNDDYIKMNTEFISKMSMK